MLFKIAWRNIWRSRTRSLVVIGAIIVGVWAEIFLMSFSEGTVKSYINNAIQSEISHIQLHQPDFEKDKEVKYYFNDASAVLQTLQSTPHVKAATVRSLSNAMISSTKGARGVQIKAVDPGPEASVTKLDEKIVDGDYFAEGKHNQIIIGKSLAGKMNIKLRSKIVLTFTNLNGDITAAAFRVVGLYETDNSMVDDAIVYTIRSEFNRLLGAEDIAHEGALFLQDPEYLDTVTSVLKTEFPNLLVQTYKEISPEIELFDSQMQLSTTIFTVILMLALIFGIVNTMLMAVLERIKELGMLMAVGMNKVRVFLMIMLETILLGLVSGPIGLALAYLTVLYFNHNGIDLGYFSEGMRQFGMSRVVFTTVRPSMFAELAFAVVLTALIASIYPSLKAIQLRPVEAIRKI
ncbi:MAG: ABC transporter permease [Lewinellaceae bacterium]|nr:ABC transporter permease [Lewinellaceae bacterium]